MTASARSHRSFKTLIQGLRGAVFLRIAPAEIDATFTQLVWLMFVAIGIQLASDFYRVGSQGELWFYGLPNLMFKMPVVLVAAWTMSVMFGRRDMILQLIVAMSAIAVAVNVGAHLLVWLVESGGLMHVLGKFGFNYLLYGNLGAAWLALAAVLAAARLFELRPRQVGAAALPAALMIWWPLAHVDDNQTLWSAPFDSESFERQQMQRDALRGEDAFYAQGRLLDKALASLEPSPPDRTGLYFVGVAGYSEQDVFMKEVRYVSNFFKAHFDTSGRSIALINNPKTVLESPIASVTSLRLALNRVGQVMDPDKDILFLYLTSHGSHDHRFSLDFGSMRFNTFDPPVLRKLIDDSGIKRRVVVVSACYSGGFIEPLQDANTLVITASAADKQSHGCSNDADFTFFGKAYFEDALRKTNSFIDAFDVAKKLIAEREARDGYEPAEPRMYVGEGMRSALERFVAERDRAAKVATAGRL